MMSSTFKMSGETTFKKIIISDPYYEANVWCRYEEDFKFSFPWNVEYEAFLSHTTFEFDGEEFPDNSVNFYLSFSRSDIQGDIRSLVQYDLDSGQTSYNSNLNRKEFEIGMDTACFIVCSDQNDYEVISTGTDGILGMVAVYSYKNQPIFIQFMGDIDADLTDIESLGKVFFSNLNVNNVLFLNHASNELTQR